MHWLKGWEIQPFWGASRNPSMHNMPSRFPGSRFPVPCWSEGSRCSAVGLSPAGQGPKLGGAGGRNAPGLNRNQIPSGENRNTARLRAGALPLALWVPGHRLPGHHLQTLAVSVLLSGTWCPAGAEAPATSLVCLPGDAGVCLQGAAEPEDWQGRAWTHPLRVCGSPPQGPLLPCGQC